MQKFFNDCKKSDIPDVDFYILKCSDLKQKRLQKIRQIVKELNPDSTERIYYGIPTVDANGKIILQYAAYKKHISLLVGNVLPAVFKKKYPLYDYTQYTVVLPDSKPFPDEFVNEICKALGDLTDEDFYA